jgi:FAD-linked sulfhydryl oxidase
MQGFFQQMTQFTQPKPEQKLECPLDASELGHAGWAFLHTMAAYFPEQPTPEERVGMHSFLELWSRFYPCTSCGSHMASDLVLDPPDTSSGSNLSQWLCRLHNKVNVRTGKPEFDCSVVDQRWKFNDKC